MANSPVAVGLANSPGVVGLPNSPVAVCVGLPNSLVAVLFLEPTLTVPKCVFSSGSELCSLMSSQRNS